MNTPNDASDSQISRLLGDEETAKLVERAPKLNAETLANGRVNELSTEDKIAKLFEGEYKALEATAAAMDRINALMPNQLWSKGPSLPTEIDLRNFDSKLDIRYEYQGKRIGWMAYDARNYDGAPDSGSNHLGFGPEKEDALQDLIEKIGPEAAEEPKASRVIHSSPFQPPELAEPERDESDDGDFDTDLEPGRE